MVRYPSHLGPSASLAALLLLAPALALAAPLPLEDLRELLTREFPETVILAIVEEEGPPKLSTAEWLELRALGASDRLLQALLREHPAVEEVAPLPGPEVAPEPDHVVAKPPVAVGTNDYRAFYDDDPELGRVFVLTNLDDEGARLGGAVHPPAPRNRVASPEPPEPRKTDPAPQAAPPELAFGQPVAYRSASAFLLPENVPPPMAFVGVSPYYGFVYPYPISHLYPPGSYTHNKLYHRVGDRGFAHYQLPAGQVFYQPPFPAAGSHRARRR